MPDTEERKIFSSLFYVDTTEPGKYYILNT